MSDHLIQPVIVQVESQREAVQRLVRHCLAMDGTRLIVIDLPPDIDASFKVEYPNNEKSCRASFALNFAAKAMCDQPFIWLEHDSIPLKPGWVKALTDEYFRLNKPFLLSSDSNPPDDLVGGIGVYSHATAWLVPAQYEKHAWDMWLIKNVPHLVARTPLIQHSYGVYDLPDGHASPHIFPRDAGMLRKEAVIFHRDPQQTLIQGTVTRARNYCMAGDLGDIVYALKAVQMMGGGKLMLGSNMGIKFNTRCREEMTPKRVENIKPLLLAQPYITGVEHFTGAPPADWVNLNRFRELFKGTKGPTCMNLQRPVLRRFNLPVQDETEPWLVVTNLIPRTIADIVVARSVRYHNPQFPWKQLVDRYSDRMIFVGLKEEYAEFSKFGKVAYITTDNLLELAQVIAGGKVFIGNQSCPYAIAEGLKKPAVQESWSEPNCLFQRPHLLHLCTDFERISEFIDRYL